MLPQIIFFSLMLFGVFFSISKHGEPKTGNYNAAITLFAFIIQFCLLYWGGFWDNVEF